VWQSRFGDATVRHLPSRNPATAVLVLAGEFDAESVVCLSEALDAVCTPQTERVLLDLAGVEFGDAAFVHALTTAHHSSPRLLLAGPLTRPVRRVFDLTGTRQLFHVVLDGPES